MAVGVRRAMRRHAGLVFAALCGGCMTVEIPPREPASAEVRATRPAPADGIRTDESGATRPSLVQRPADLPAARPGSAPVPPPLDRDAEVTRKSGADVAIVPSRASAPPAISTGEASRPTNRDAADPDIVPALPPAPLPDARPLPADFGAKATEVALGMLGRPYRLGGITPDGFDCSGLVYYSFGQLGVSVPRDTQSLRDITTAIPDRLRRIGDLVFFHIQGRQYSHVGLYVGDGRFLHAPATGGEVRIERLSVGYWTKRYAGTRRLNFAPVNLGVR